MRFERAGRSMAPRQDDRDGVGGLTASWHDTPLG